MNTEVKTIKTESFSMKYFSFGKGKKTFIMLPGLSIKSVMLSAQLVAQSYQMFNDDYTVYVFDIKEDVNKEYRIEEMAEDLAEAINTLGLKDLYVFGASMGAMIGMSFTIKYPDLVKKLFIASSSSCPKEDSDGSIDKWIELAQENRIEELCLNMGERTYTEEVFEQNKEAFILMAKSVNEEERQKFINLTKGIKSFDVRKELELIKCPVLVVGAKDDKVFKDGACQRIVECINRKEDVELYMYETGGHAVYDFALDYKQRIMEFFNK